MFKASEMLVFRHYFVSSGQIFDQMKNFSTLWNYLIQFGFDNIVILIHTKSIE